MSDSAMQTRYVGSGVVPEMESENVLLCVASCTVIAISRQKEARSRDHARLFSNDLNFF